jgi:hypothetical protein
MIAVGDGEEEFAPDTKDLTPRPLGAKGGAARAESLSTKRRKEIAKKAEKRWGEKKK